MRACVCSCACNPVQHKHAHTHTHTHKTQRGYNAETFYGMMNKFETEEIKLVTNGKFDAEIEDLRQDKGKVWSFLSVRE